MNAIGKGRFRYSLNRLGALAMRFIQALILLVLLGAIIIFAMENSRTVPVRFLGWSLDSPLALMSVVIYFLGMISGWTIVGFMGRSLRRVAERRQ